MGNNGNLEWNKDLQPVQMPNENTDTESLEEQKRIRYKQDTRARAYLTRWVCSIVTLWLVFAIGLTIALHLPFKHIEDNVAMVIFGTMTVNVLGLANIVLRGLFDKKQ